LAEGTEVRSENSMTASGKKGAAYFGQNQNPRVTREKKEITISDSPTKGDRSAIGRGVEGNKTARGAAVCIQEKRFSPFGGGICKNRSKKKLESKRV